MGPLIRDARRHKGLTQSELARLLGPARARSRGSSRVNRTSPSRCSPASARPSTPSSSASGTPAAAPAHRRRPAKLSGSIDVKTSKNAAVALLCASLLNRGTHDLRNLARIEEVNRILEVLDLDRREGTRWLPDSNDLEIVPPAQLDLDSIDVEAARRTRTVIMFLGPLLHDHPDFRCPMPVAATSAPAPSSRTCLRCSPSVSDVEATARLLRVSRRRQVSTQADHPHRAWRHGDRERPHGRRPSPGTT
jgi:UDP-N-acetylglucosamine 1-carboxyvinyltransferase